MDIHAELATVYAARDRAVIVLSLSGHDNAAALLGSLMLLHESGGATTWMARLVRLLRNLSRSGLHSEADEVATVMGALARLTDDLIQEHMPASPFVRAAEIACGSDKPERVREIVANYWGKVGNDGHGDAA